MHHRRPRLAALLTAFLAVLAAAPSAFAADPGRWALSSVERVPSAWYQGLSGPGPGQLFFAGTNALYRTRADGQADYEVPTVIPRELTANPGFNHVGDPGWDAGRERVIAPLECYTPGGANGGNTCGRGGFAVFDRGLRWQFAVLLDQSEIAKAMWAEVSPGGELIWTSSGADLLAYRSADVGQANAYPSGAPLRAAVRLSGAVPPSGVTGAAFYEGRLYLSGQGAGPMQLWSVDVGGREPAIPRLEAERDIAGESEGLTAFSGRGGELHWLVTPFALGRAPTYGTGRNALLHLVPASDGALQLITPRRSLRAGRPATLQVTARQTLRGETLPAEGVTVRVGGATATTDGAGEAELHVRTLRRGSLPLRATRGDLVAPPVALNVLPAIGIPLAGRPAMRLSAGASSRRVRAAALVDCSGATGCESPPRAVRAGACVRARGGSDLAIRLHARPVRTLDVLVQSSDGAYVSGGHALAVGRSALSWRFPLRGRVPRRLKVTVIGIYPDRTGAIVVATLRRDGC